MVRHNHIIPSQVYSYFCSQYMQSAEICRPDYIISSGSVLRQINSGDKAKASCIICSVQDDIIMQRLKRKDLFSSYGIFLLAVVTIEFQCIEYVVSEGNGSVSLVVVKRGSSTSAIAV